MPIKLDQGNYHVWRSLFLPILRSHNLLGLVDGSTPCPPQFLIGSDGKLSTEVNPKYSEWIVKNQHLLSWINATLSETKLPYIVGLHSSKAVWEDLEKWYASLTCSHVIQLKQQLQNLKKGSSPMQDYFSKSKFWLTNLQLAVLLLMKMI